MTINNETLSRAYDRSYYTITGAGGDLQEWKDGYNAMLAEHNNARRENSLHGTEKLWMNF